MSKYGFMKLGDERGDTDVFVTVDTVGLDVLLETFKDFLQASGFVIDGDIVVEASDDTV